MNRIVAVYLGACFAALCLFGTILFTFGAPVIGQAYEDKKAYCGYLH